jgi:hypothetical protein
MKCVKTWKVLTNFRLKVEFVRRRMQIRFSILRCKLFWVIHPDSDKTFSPANSCWRRLRRKWNTINSKIIMSRLWLSHNPYLIESVIKLPHSLQRIWKALAGNEAFCSEFICDSRFQIFMLKITWQFHYLCNGMIVSKQGSQKNTKSI